MHFSSYYPRIYFSEEFNNSDSNNVPLSIQGGYMLIYINICDVRIMVTLLRVQVLVIEIIIVLNNICTM